MQYNIFINQKAIIENFPELDIIDSAIINYFTFSLASDDKNRDQLDWKEEGENYRYVCLRYQDFIQDMPLLRINQKVSINQRLKKLKKSGIIKIRTIRTEKGRWKTYIRLTDKINVLNFESKKTPVKFELNGLKGNPLNGDLTGNDTVYVYNNNNNNITTSIRFEENRAYLKTLIDEKKIPPCPEKIYDWRYPVQSKSPHTFMIGLYWKVKGFNFPDKEIAVGQIKRYNKIASDYAKEFKIEDFNDLLQWINLDSEEKGNYTWTLETLRKKAGEYYQDIENNRWDKTKLCLI